MPDKLDTTHAVLDRELIVYRRERSCIWQCRYKVDGIWQRASTKERELAKAKNKALELRMEAEIRKRSNLPIVTRKFSSIAKFAIDRMNSELVAGKGKASYPAYIRVINEYFIPAFSGRNIANIDIDALNELDEWRITKMGKAPSHSTLLTHNAALNRVLDEAVTRGFLTEASRPKLESKGRKSTRRASFSLQEVKALLVNFDAWIDRARNDHSREMREIMRDYVELLLDTGARPGKELMNLKWKQISYSISPKATNTGEVDDEGDAIELVNMNKAIEFPVTGKVGTRITVGRLMAVKALQRVAERNYGLRGNVAYPLREVIEKHGNDYVLRTKEKKQDVSSSFQNLLESYLDEHSLLIDPITEQKRVFYSFRHTYATLALTHDKVPIHTLSKQMGTSVGMIEKHYSHLKVIEAMEQLRGEETRKLIANTHTVSELYKSKRVVRAEQK